MSLSFKRSIIASLIFHFGGAWILTVIHACSLFEEIHFNVSESASIGSVSSSSMVEITLDPADSPKKTSSETSDPIPSPESVVDTSNSFNVTSLDFSNSFSKDDLLKDIPRANSKSFVTSISPRIPKPEALPLATPSLPSSPQGVQDPGILSYTPPCLLSNPTPIYPEICRKLEVEGVVKVLIDIGSDGVVYDAAVDRTSGNPHLDRSALETVRRWKFKPAKKSKQAVEASIKVIVHFELQNS
jgi:TonB family protein